MKRALALVLALVFVLGLATVSYAEEKVPLTALFIAHPLTKSVEEMQWLKEIADDAGVEITWEQIYTERGTGKIKTDTWMDDFSGMIEACYTPILELGCGDGNDTFRLMQMGKKVIACDQSETALKNLRMNVPNVFETRCLNILEKLPFDDNMFGIVMRDLLRISRAGCRTSCRGLPTVSTQIQAW